MDSLFGLEGKVRGIKSMALSQTVGGERGQQAPRESRFWQPGGLSGVTLKSLNSGEFEHQSSLTRVPVSFQACVAVVI